LTKEESHADEYPLPSELTFDWKEAHDDIINEIRWHLRNTGAEKIVIGLSGGVDSSLSLYLAVRSVGVENVVAMFLPEAGVTPDYDEEDARAVASLLGIELIVKEISPLVEAFSNEISELRGNSLALANVKARIRMILLYAEANLIGRAQVLGTSDKSELLLGYTTKYGDSGADFLPIGDLYKSQVRYMASKVGLPRRVWMKPPSPQLIKGKSAQSELGLPYEVLDRILYYRVDHRYPEEKIARILSLPVETVNHYCMMIIKSDHKRKAPPIGKVGGATINMDWRMPIE
jgi:NAD+ synthase